jgi:hypothetical protein
MIGTAIETGTSLGKDVTRIVIKDTSLHLESTLRDSGRRMVIDIMIGIRTATGRGMTRRIDDRYRLSIHTTEAMVSSYPEKSSILMFL